MTFSATKQGKAIYKWGKSIFFLVVHNPYVKDINKQMKTNDNKQMITNKTNQCIKK